jgi:MFS family permease
MMVIGRIIAGAGTSVVSTAVPLYLSEISPARRRGAFIALNQVGIVFGYVCFPGRNVDFFF